MEEKNIIPDDSGGISGVAYQNKDISSKHFAEEFKDTFFKVYGLDLPDIVRTEPTELPAVEVSDMAMDNFYYLSDGSYAIVDYESRYSEENKVKYLNYVARVLKRLYNKNKLIPKIRIVIVYTADVTKGSTVPVLDMGDEKLNLTEAFLSDLNAEEILVYSEQKVSSGAELTDEEKLRLMLCPLAVKGKPAKIDMIHRVIMLVKQMEDVDDQRKILSGMLAFCDKVICREDIEEIRRIIKMTQFERFIYEEKMEAVNKAKEETEKEATDKTSRAIAANFLSDGLDIESVSRNTGLELSVVQEMARKLEEQKKEKKAAVS